MKTYKCDVCGTETASQNYLAKHKLVHTQNLSKSQSIQEEEILSNDKMLTCEHCGKVFTSNGYRKHITTISGDKPYECFFARKYLQKLII